MDPDFDPAGGSGIIDRLLSAQPVVQNGACRLQWQPIDTICSKESNALPTTGTFPTTLDDSRMKQSLTN